MTLLSILVTPCSLQAQYSANASASVTATVLPSSGVEVRERISFQSEEGTIRRDYYIKVLETGNYSLQIFDESNTASSLSKVTGEKNTYQLQGRESGTKRIIQVALLSS
jgi:hypothetical protein